MNAMVFAIRKEVFGDGLLTLFGDLEGSKLQKKVGDLLSKHCFYEGI